MVTSKLNTKLSVLPINNSLLTLILSNLQSKGKAAELEPCHRKKKKKTSLELSVCGKPLLISCLPTEEPKPAVQHEVITCI